MSEDLVNGRPMSDMAALRELRAAVNALQIVPGIGHPSRATALSLVSEYVDGAVRRLQGVEGYPHSKPAPDMAAAGKSSWDEYYAIADAAERRRVRAELGRALVAAGFRLLGQPGLDRTDGVDDRVDDVTEDPAVPVGAESARGAHTSLVDVVDELAGDGQVRHGSPVDSSGGATPGAEGASSDAPIVVGEGDSGSGAVSYPASGPLSPADVAPVLRILADVLSRAQLGADR